MISETEHAAGIVPAGGTAEPYLLSVVGMARRAVRAARSGE